MWGSTVANRQRVQWIEIDIPRCTLTWGVGACTAAFGAAIKRKCYNTFQTCVVEPAFVSAPQTVVFFPPVSGAPLNSLPCISGPIKETESTVNIAGAEPNMSAFGRRGTVQFPVADFVDNDAWFDRYQAERVSGAAQTDEAGYQPVERGTVFTKLKARWPHFAGRACRVKDGWLEDGILTVEATRHYILTDFETDKPGAAVFKGRDILDVAGNDRALAPKPCRGKVKTAITAGSASLTLTPVGIGADDYAASGRAVIGSEIVSFTRSGDVLTLTGRGLAGTTAAGHSALASVQQTLYYDRVRADIVANDLLTNFAPVQSASIPVAAWDAEMQQGAPGMILKTEVTKPEPVGKLAAELGLLGLSFWWDGDTHTVGMKTNRPIFNDVTFEITDDDIVRDGIDLKSRDDRRLTEVLFQTVQIDPTKALSDDNFTRYEYTIDGDAKSPDAYGDSRLKVEKIRWINQGNDALVRVLSLRYLKRFSTAPDHVSVVVRREQYPTIGLADVAFLTSTMRTDDTGKASRMAYQVISKQNAGGGLVDLLLQRYFYDGRYARFLRDTDPVNYNDASPEVIARGFYFVSNATPVFDDGTGPYLFA